MHFFFNFFFAFLFSFPSSIAFYKSSHPTPHPTAYSQKKFTNTTKSYFVFLQNKKKTTFANTNTHWHTL